MVSNNITWNIPSVENFCLNKNKKLYMSIFSNVILNCENLEATKMTFIM